MNKEFLAQALAESNYASELAWQQDGICRQTDPEAFFPETNRDSKDPVAVCKSCPVIRDCLIFAIENDEEYGVWGGIDFTHRKKSINTTKKSQHRPKEIKELANRLRNQESDFATIYAKIRKGLTTKGWGKSD